MNHHSGAIMVGKIFMFVLVAITLFGCKKNGPVSSSAEPLASTAGVYVVNQGNFTKSNSSLSFYVPDSNKVYPDVFFAANGRSLGDVGNDMVIFENKGYIVVNNSNKIEIISTANNKSLGTLYVGNNSPCKIAIVSESKGYITNLYSGSVTSFNPTTYAIIKDSIKVGLNPQGIAVASGRVYVCNSGYGADSTISVIDPGTDAVVQTITVAVQPTNIAVDADGNVVVACYGYVGYSNPANDTPGNITIINPNTNTIVATIPLPLPTYGHPSGLAVSAHGYGFIIAQNGVAKFDTKAASITVPLFITKTPYCIAVDDVTENIYLGDAKDYVQDGTLYSYTKSGLIGDSATVGIIPGAIVFKH